VSESLVAAVDLPPTFLDYLDAAPLPKAHGRSLRGVVDGKDKGCEFVFGERNEPKSPAASRMVRTKQWKLCLLPRGAHELYDLKNDPDETRNVYAEPTNAGVVKELNSRLKRHMAEVGDQAVLKTFFQI
jgi:arylsulfatase A-like enzyme